MPKRCGSCGVVKFADDFHRDRGRQDGRHPYCRKCKSEKEKQYRAARPEEVRALARARYYRNHATAKKQQRDRYQLLGRSRHTEYRGRYLERQFGITQAEYEALWESQDGCCAVCRRPETDVDPRWGSVRLLAVDHDHATGRVRGLLCRKCNTAIGLLGEHLAVAERLVGYLGEPDAG